MAEPEDGRRAQAAEGGSPSELSLVVWFATLSIFCLGLPRVFTSTAAFSLFLASYDASLLPVSYIAVALLVPAVGYLYLQLEERLPFATLLLVALVADAMALALLRAYMLLDGPDWLTLVAIIWVEVDWVIGSLVFWGLAERSFNVRQAKRYFGRIGAGEPAAMIAGGLATPLVLTVIAPGDLLWISSASLVVSAAIILALTRLAGHAPADEPHEPQEATDTRSSRPRSDSVVRRYLMMVFAMIVVGETVHFFIDNAFYMEAQKYYPDEQNLASFIALILALAAVVQLLCGTVVAPWVLRRFGIRQALLVLPVMTAGLGAALLLGGALGASLAVFTLMVALNITDGAVRQGVYRPAFLTLYQPLPPRLRTRAQTLGETLYEQIGAGGAGLVLLFLNNVLAFEAVGLVGAAMLLVAVWIAQAWLVYPGYLGALSHTLSTRQLDHTPLDLGDAAAQSFQGKLLSLYLFARTNT